MCNDQRVSQLIGFYPGVSRRELARVVDDLRNQFLDHDGRVVYVATGIVSCVGCSQETVIRMRSFLDGRLHRPGLKPR